MNDATKVGLWQDIQKMHSEGLGVDIRIVENECFRVFRYGEVVFTTTSLEALHGFISALSL